MDLQLDSFDVRLLNLLQHNNLAGAAELAKEVPLSPSAITRRLRRLRESGVIVRDMALISPLVVNRRVRALIFVQLQQQSETQSLAAFQNALDRAPEVQTCFEISGGFDLAVMVVTRDLRAFNDFADEIFARSPAVGRYETRFIKKELKNQPIVHLDDTDAA